MKALFALALFVAVTIPLGLCADRGSPGSVTFDNAIDKVEAKAKVRVEAKAKVRVDVLGLDLVLAEAIPLVNTLEKIEEEEIVLDKVLEIVLNKATWDRELQEKVLHKVLDKAIADPELQDKVLEDKYIVMALGQAHPEYRERVLANPELKALVLERVLAEVNANPELRAEVLAEVKKIVNEIVDDEEEEKQKSSGLTGGSRYFAGMTGVTVISVILVILVIAGLNWQSQHRKSGYFADAGRLQK